MATYEGEGTDAGVRAGNRHEDSWPGNREAVARKP